MVNSFVSVFSRHKSFTLLCLTPKLYHSQHPKLTFNLQLSFHSRFRSINIWYPRQRGQYFRQMEYNTSLGSVNESAVFRDGRSGLSIASQVSFLAVVIFVAITANGVVCYVIHRTPHLHNVINM